MDYEKIEILENDDEARLLGSILDEWGIPHIIRSYHDTAFNGLYQTQKGWGYISAPVEFKEEVKKILKDLRE
jgi:hypothetical protein